MQMLMSLVLGVAIAGLDKPVSVTIEGTPWISGLEAARAEAKAVGKPILHLQMFGALDDAYC